MAIKITDECINCGACEPECPNNAIYEGGVEWAFTDGTTVKGEVRLMDGSLVDSDQRNAPIANDTYYIVPNKCTECQGFHEEPQCAAVCPVDCCVPDEMYRETVEELLAKKKNYTYKYLRLMAYQAGDISCFGEGIEKYFRLFSKRKLPVLLKKLLFILPGLFLFFLLPASCKRKNNNEMKKSPEEILKADKTFSELSKKEGMKLAFLEYIDNEGILLRPGHLPIVGANAIDFLSQVNDSSYRLTWNPAGGEIAASGDLGYTYGIYKLEMKDTVLKGTYVSIWKKQKDGKWKFVLDSGNDGLDTALKGQ